MSSKWLTKLVNDLNSILEVLDYFESEYEFLQKHLEVKGLKIIEVGSKVPGLSETCYARYSELKLIIDYLKTMQDEAENTARLNVLNTKNRSYTAVQIEGQVDADAQVLLLRRVQLLLKHEFDKFTGVSQGIERLHYQIKFISEMRQAGLEDATI